MTTVTSEEALEYLSETLTFGSTVYVVQHQVSASGMTRWLSLFGPPDASGRLPYLNGWVAAVTGLKQAKYGHLVVEGVGMDMHFATVYGLAQRLFPQHEAIQALNYQSLG